MNDNNFFKDNDSFWELNNQQQQEAENALLDQYETECDRSLNEQLIYERDQSAQRLFQAFQTSACAVAQVFKDKGSGSNTAAYNAFQKAAASITALYKESLDACKAHDDVGMAIGQQRKVKELIAWLRKKKQRRTIRKDELVSFLIGKPIAPMPRQQRQPSQQPSMFSSSHQTPLNMDPDLATFRDALLTNKRPRDDSSSFHHQHIHTTAPTAAGATSDLECFFCEQVARHIDNTSSSNTSPSSSMASPIMFNSSGNGNAASVMMMDTDSPTRKKSRFY